MSEDFSAWILSADKHDHIANNLTQSWCRLSEYHSDYAKAKFEWYSNDTGDEIKVPVGTMIIEKLLHQYMLTWYDIQAIQALRDEQC
jgi:hypothetical protein